MSLQDQLLTEQSKLASLGDEMDAISDVATAENRELSTDELAMLEQYPAKIETAKNRCESLKKSIKAMSRAADRRTVQSNLDVDDQPLTVQPAPRIRHKGIRSQFFESSKDAYQTGMWMCATLGKNNTAREYCREHGVGNWSMAMEEGTDSLGGFSVPDPLANTIVELMQDFGVFRQYAQNVPMTSDTLRVPKLPEVPTTNGSPDSSLTVYYPDEGSAITPSDLTFEQVSMSATKYATLALWSTELNEDAVISMSDLLARDIARRFSWAEDVNSFNGTGSAPAITGVTNALQAGAKVVLESTNTALSDITLADLNNMLAILKEYPGLTPRYYMHKYVWWNVVVPLLQAAGGTNMPQLEAGADMQLNGVPVVFTQVLPGQAATAGDAVIVAGDLGLGAYCAIRRNVSIRILTELYAASDQLAIVATMRGDSVTHSVGDASEAGCISSLELAAS